MATQADIDRIEAAIARGELRVRAPDGSEVTYRSVSDLQQALAVLQNRMATTSFSRTTLASFARD
jgi:hypothetical protein